MVMASTCSLAQDLSFEPMLITVASLVWLGEPIWVSSIEREELAGSGFDPGTFGTEGERLASELSRQMGNEISISLEDLAMNLSDVIGLTLSEVRQAISLL